MRTQHHSPRLRPSSPPLSVSRLSGAECSRFSQELRSPYAKLTSRRNVAYSGLPAFLQCRQSREDSHFLEFADLRHLDQSFQFSRKARCTLTGPDFRSLRESRAFSAKLVDAGLGLLKAGQTQVFVASTSLATNIFTSNYSRTRLSLAQYE